MRPKPFDPYRTNRNLVSHKAPSDASSTSKDLLSQKTSPEVICRPVVGVSFSQQSHRSILTRTEQNPSVSRIYNPYALVNPNIPPERPNLRNEEIQAHYARVQARYAHLEEAKEEEEAEEVVATRRSQITNDQAESLIKSRREESKRGLKSYYHSQR